MGIQERKLRHKNQVRQSILDFAESIAANEGWEAVTMRRISAEIEYALPVIYTHFKNKEEIISTLAVKGFTTLLDELQSIITKDNSILNISKELSQAYLRFGKKNKALYLAMYGQEGVSSFMSGNPSEGEKVFDFIQGWLKHLTDTNQAIIPDTWAATKLIWATLHGLVTLNNINQIDDKNIKIEQVVDDFINILAKSWNMT